MNGHACLGSTIRRLAGAVLILSLTVSAAQAADGRITFSGAITAPTCASAVQSVEQAMQSRAHAVGVPDPSVEQGHCHDAHSRAPYEARGFDLRITELPSAMVDTRVAGYFKGFSDVSDTLLATQTYQ